MYSSLFLINTFFYYSFFFYYFFFKNLESSNKVFFYIFVKWSQKLGIGKSLTERRGVKINHGLLINYAESVLSIYVCENMKTGKEKILYTYDLEGAEKSWNFITHQ